MKNHLRVITLVILTFSVVFYGYKWGFHDKQVNKIEVVSQPDVINKEFVYNLLCYLSTSRLIDMQIAGEEILRWEGILDKTGTNVIKEVIRQQGPLDKFKHYPQNDIIDPETYSQYYYHRHREGEHGHFHVFLHRNGMPKTVTLSTSPITLPYAHIIAISMNDSGNAISLFTTNQWVTGEDWYTAVEVAHMMEYIKIGHAYPSWPTNQWMNAMMRLFYPQILYLIHKRDDVLTFWNQKHPGMHIFDNHDLEILSEQPISVDLQMEVIADILRARNL